LSKAKLRGLVPSKLYVNVVLPLVFIGVVIGACHSAVNSSVFHLRTVEVAGGSRMAAESVESLIRQVAGESVLQADLPAIRSLLKQRPLIKEAEVTRVLPDTIRVSITERRPVAVVAQSGQTPVCVDEEAVIIGAFRLMGEQSMPLLFGWNEEDSLLAMSENRQRVSLYLQLEKELREAGQEYWKSIDQVNLRNLQDVVVNLTDSPLTWIHLGDRDFGSRFALSLQILSAVKNHDAAELQRLGITPSTEIMGAEAISYLDVSQPSRVVVRLPDARRTQATVQEPAPAKSERSKKRAAVRANQQSKTRRLQVR